MCRRRRRARSIGRLVRACPATVWSSRGCSWRSGRCVRGRSGAGRPGSTVRDRARLVQTESAWVFLENSAAWNYVVVIPGGWSYVRQQEAGVASVAEALPAGVAGTGGPAGPRDERGDRGARRGDRPGRPPAGDRDGDPPRVGQAGRGRRRPAARGPTEQQRRLAELERENRELRRANEILKAARLSSRGSSTRACGSSGLHRRTRTGRPLRWGVEPICRVLQVAPSTYYAAKSRPPSPAGGRGRRAQGADPPGVPGAVRRVRRGEGLAAAGPGGGRGGPGPGGPADGRAGPRRGDPGQDDADHGAGEARRSRCRPTWCAATSRPARRTGCGSPI